MVMSDTHLDVDIERNIDHFRTALADIASIEPRPECIVIVGDFTNNGAAEEYELARSLVAESDFDYASDIVKLMGNHDQNSADFDADKAGFDDQYVRFMNEAGTDRVYYDTTRGAQHFICLGPDKAAPGDTTHFDFTDEQMSWLDDLLAKDEQAGVNSFVFCHEPLHETVRSSMPGTYGYNNSLIDDEKLASIIRKHPRTIYLSGHTHAHPDIARPYANGPLYVNDGAVATGQIAPNATDFATQFVGAFGWRVTVYEDRLQFDARDFLEGAWLDSLAYTHRL